jgi:hypothetical protein
MSAAWPGNKLGRHPCATASPLSLEVRALASLEG